MEKLTVIPRLEQVKILMIAEVSFWESVPKTSCPSEAARAEITSRIQSCSMLLDFDIFFLIKYSPNSRHEKHSSKKITVLRWILRMR